MIPSSPLPPEAACMRAVFETTWGVLAVEANETAVTRLHLPGFVPDDFVATSASSPLLRQVEREIGEYFNRKRREFGIPLAPAGTGFMQAVWQRLVQIPFGELDTYGGVAKALGNPGASRAVGMACRNNPIPLLIPCHRVVGAGNKLTGFSGGGVDAKRRLIELEMGGLFATL